MRFSRQWFFLWVVSASLLFIACKRHKASSEYQSPPGYDLTKPFRIKLPPELDEISGIAFYPKDSSVFCVADEFGLLYKVFLNRKKRIIKWKFSKSGDYEDLLLLDSVFYVLKSKGSFLEVIFHKGDSIRVETLEPSIEGNNEFEIVYWDAQKKQMVMVCKECEQDQKNKVSAIAFDPASRSDSVAYVLQEQEIEKRLGDKIKFKPSAAAINPLTNELFIISAVNDALVICNTNGQVNAVYKIDPVLFKQPEGMTFTPYGDLIISNEAAESGPANILFFKYKRKG